MNFQTVIPDLKFVLNMCLSITHNNGNSDSSRGGEFLRERKGSRPLAHANNC